MNLTLDEYIIMPNHIHGIIRIGRNEFYKFNDDHAIHGSRDAIACPAEAQTNYWVCQTTSLYKQWLKIINI